jgi:DNA-binding transcriptional regulator YiaG
MHSNELENFELDEDGSFLYWAQADLRMGASELIQAVDPMYLADIEIKRHREDNAGAALRSMREQRGLKQADIPGISERQVRRLEKGVSRLTSDAALLLAHAFDLTIEDFLQELGRRLRSSSTTTIHA